MQKQFFSMCSVFLVAVSTIPSFTLPAAAMTETTIEKDGYSFQLQNYSESAIDFVPQSNGCYNASWTQNEESLNLEFGAFEPLDTTTHVMEYGDIVRYYEADFKTDGNAYLAYTGYFNVPQKEAGLTMTVDFNIVEAWGSVKPVEGANSPLKLGTICSDDKEYDLYKCTSAMTSVTGERKIAYSYYSVCSQSPAKVNENNHLSGTVTISNHLKAWAALSNGLDSNAGDDFDYPFYNLGLGVYAFQNSGSVDIQRSEAVKAPSEMKLLTLGSETHEPSAGDLMLFNSGCISGDFTLPDTFTQIDDNMFSDCQLLHSITIPNTVTDIGENAFQNCSKLTKLSIPDSVTHIGKYAFAGCEALTEITIPEKVTAIEEGAFSGCSSLKEITFLNGDLSFDDTVFADCSNVTIKGYSGSAVEKSANKYNLPFEASEPSVVPVGALGDVNEDNDVNISDVIVLSRYISEDATITISAQGLINADLDSDNQINMNDVNMMLRKIAHLD